MKETSWPLVSGIFGNFGPFFVRGTIANVSRADTITKIALTIIIGGARLEQYNT